MTLKNIELANAARKKVREHCMALYVTESKTHLIVKFPEGYSLDGVRVSMANGITWACDKALAKMEQVWKGA